MKETERFLDKLAMLTQEETGDQNDLYLVKKWNL